MTFTVFSPYDPTRLTYVFPDVAGNPSCNFSNPVAPLTFTITGDGTSNTFYSTTANSYYWPIHEFNSTGNMTVPFSNKTAISYSAIGSVHDPYRTQRRVAGFP
ncbi:MAG: hypothetical protein ACKO96_46650, partial [Flammeovirgaceae bacterium]